MQATVAHVSKPSGGPWLLCLVGWDSSKTARGWLACGCPVLRIVLRFLLCSFRSLVHIRSFLFLFHKWEATKSFFFGGWRGVVIVFLIFIHLKSCYLKVLGVGRPWWCSGQESTCRCRGHRFDPCSGKTPQAEGSESPSTTTPQPAL